MDTCSDDEHDHRTSKGKNRVRPDEQSPLLGESSHQPEQPHSRSRPTRRLLLTVFLTTLALTVLAVVALAALALSYSARISHTDPADALVLRGPHAVAVLNASQTGGVWLQIDGDAGLDADTFLDDGSTLAALMSPFARWAVRRMHTVTITVAPISLTAHGYHLATLTLPLLTLPLTLDRTAGSTWLTPLSLTVHATPTTNASALAEFAKMTWHTRSIHVVASVPRVRVQGGKANESGWRRRLDVVQRNVDVRVRFKLPALPGLPPTPSVDDLVSLTSFYIDSNPAGVTLRAAVSLRFALPSSPHIHLPALPFTVSLPSASPNTSTIPVAAVTTSPFTLPAHTLTITGRVLPLPHAATPSLSSFLSVYLAATPPGPRILLSSPLLPTLLVPAHFPAPAQRPRLLRTVTIADMRIAAHGAGVTASGTVHARVVLPRGVDVALHARRLWPDVLVFDGAVPAYFAADPVPTPTPTPTARAVPHIWPGEWLPAHSTHGAVDENDSDAEDGTPKPPLPSPLPPRAFARIRPDDWLPATSARINDTVSEDEGGAAYAVTARVVDVPLEVLPGREREFQRFVAKVVFGSQGALAGVRGVAAVAASVDGLPLLDGDEAGVFELTDLPFEGSFRVGRKGG